MICVPEMHAAAGCIAAGQGGSWGEAAELGFPSLVGLGTNTGYASETAR